MNEQRLDFCKRFMGVHHTIKLSETLEKDLRDVTDGHMPDVVIDATGSSASMSSAFGLVAPGGKLVYVGITTDEVKFRHPPSTRLKGRSSVPEMPSPPTSSGSSA